ncbi:MAG: hypothetical protein ACHQ7N_08340 [Candidatus Methylomirabilales bacterium]
MRTWILAMLVVLAVDSLSRCSLLLRDQYPRSVPRWLEILCLAWAIGLLAWGVWVLRTG